MMVYCVSEAAVFFSGASLASFLNVVCSRWPLIRAGVREQGQPVTLAWPSSRCDACHHTIRWHDNLPVMGWLKRRGRCATCGERFSPRHAVWEAMAGALLALPALVLGIALPALGLGFAALLCLYAPALYRAAVLQLTDQDAP